jgi:inosine/xanthosine triphosphate pyrophosphatase family protein
MAELADAEKDAISHRAGAVAQLMHWLTTAG